MKIANLNLSHKNRAITIAEIGINHEGNFQKCLKMVIKAKNSGADLVKLQVADPKSDYDSILVHIKFLNQHHFQKKRFLIFTNLLSKKK